MGVIASLKHIKDTIEAALNDSSIPVYIGKNKVDSINQKGEIWIDLDTAAKKTIDADQVEMEEDVRIWVARDLDKYQGAHAHSDANAKSMLEQMLEVRETIVEALEPIENGVASKFACLEFQSIAHDEKPSNDPFRWVLISYTLKYERAKGTA